MHFISSEKTWNRKSSPIWKEIFSQPHPVTKMVEANSSIQSDSLIEIVGDVIDENNVGVG
jgi:hypothetical protein